jgi:enoyl-CoA hydratase/carnithine racemase
MRSDRGYFCLPEIDLKVTLPSGMMSLLKLKLAPPVLRDLLLTGRRVGGEEAVRLGIVDEACTAGEVLPNAVSRATALAAKDRETYAAMKRNLNHP